jgi:hypothetical protein
VKSEDRASNGADLGTVHVMAPPVSIRCGNCGEGVAAVEVAQYRWGNTALFTRWLQCPGCNEGSVKLKDGSVYPTAPAGGNVRNLPPDVEQAWREARTAHAVAAYTASEIMCRKILMHLAVDVAGAKPGKTFAEYVDALDSAGYISTGLKPTVDTIRQRGNGANHELPASTETDSLTTLGITEHLLTSVYAFAAPPAP